MLGKSLAALFIAAWLAPPAFGAVTEEDFTLKTTANLLNLCSVAADDPRAREAIHMCHGYLVGALHFYEAEVAGSPGERLVCLPEKRPARDEAIAMFVQWAEVRPLFFLELPVQTEFRFFSETWPCKSPAASASSDFERSTP
jgi:hypothetical protein